MWIYIYVCVCVCIYNQINRELKSKNKYSVNQTRTRQQNVVHRNGTTYIGKNFPNNFLEQRVILFRFPLNSALRDLLF
jgi:hypothetical protein